MSILQVNNLEGPDWDDFRIRMEGDAHLNINGTLAMSSSAQFCLPRGTTAERPSTPVAGMIRFNVTTNSAEYYNGTEWIQMPLGATNDGSDATKPAVSAKALFDAGIVTSGKSKRFITTSAGVKEVWCDFDTQDADGNSG